MFRKFKNYLFGTMPSPADATLFYNGAGGFTTPTGGVNRRQVTFVIDGAGVAITTGLKGYVSLPVSGTWKKWRILSIDGTGPATAGSIVIDLWKDTYAAYPPTVADTITAAAKPTLTAANKSESTALTGWTTAFTAGDTLAYNVDSAATVTKIMMALEFE